MLNIDQSTQRHKSKRVAYRSPIDNRPLDLRRFIANFCIKLGGELNSKGCYLAINISPVMPRFFSGDSLVIHDLLNNIIHSTLKHLHSGGIEIQVRSEEVSATQHKVFFVITVSGHHEIPGAKLKTIFHSSSEQIAADCLVSTRNMSIAKSITTTLGGDIVISSTFDAGTTYTASINLAGPIPEFQQSLGGRSV